MARESSSFLFVFCVWKRRRRGEEEEFKKRLRSEAKSKRASERESERENAFLFTLCLHSLPLYASLPFRIIMSRLRCATSGSRLEGREERMTATKEGKRHAEKETNPRWQSNSTSNWAVFLFFSLASLGFQKRPSLSSGRMRIFSVCQLTDPRVRVDDELAPLHFEKEGKERERRGGKRQSEKKEKQ